MNRPKTTIIFGAPGSGKTTRALGLAAGKKTFQAIDFYELDSFGYLISADTECIIIEGITKKNLERVLSLITSTTMRIYRQRQPDLVINRPELVFTADKKMRKHFSASRPFLELIEL